MNITSVKIFPINEEKLKAYVTIVIEDSLVIHDIKVIVGKAGRFFVAMPSKKCKNGTFRDIAHPLNQDIRAYLEQKILETYNSKVKYLNSHIREKQTYYESMKKSG